MQGEIQQLIKDYVDKMPPLPASVGKVLEICKNPMTNPNDLNRVISLDPVLLGRVMKLINSAYYGFSQEITSLVRAIIMLGINTVKNLAVSTAVLRTVQQTRKEAQSPLNMDGFWRHCLAVGVTSKLIAMKLGEDPKILEEYFIAGLLHDVGKIPVNNRLGPHYLRALNKADGERIELRDAESALFGQDHTAFGRQVMETWGLGDELLDPVVYHHNPQDYQGAHPKLVRTVCVADYFCNVMELGFGGNKHPAKPHPSVFLNLGMEWDDVVDLEDQVNTEIEKAQVFLKIST